MAEDILNFFEFVKINFHNEQHARIRITRPRPNWFQNFYEIDFFKWMKEVEKKKYYIKYVNVLTPHMGILKCRTYIQKINPLPRGDNDVIPVERWPSWSYKYIMVLGAKETGLPEYYINFLSDVKDNGDEGCIRTDCLLLRYAQDAPCECRVPGRIPRQPLKLDLKAKRSVTVQTSSLKKSKSK